MALLLKLVSWPFNGIFIAAIARFKGIAFGIQATHLYSAVKCSFVTLALNECKLMPHTLLVQVSGVLKMTISQICSSAVSFTISMTQPLPVLCFPFQNFWLPKQEPSHALSFNVGYNLWFCFGATFFFATFSFPFPDCSQEVILEDWLWTAKGTVL